MAISVKKYEDKDLSDMIRIWNEVVEDGVAFPQETPLDKRVSGPYNKEKSRGEEWVGRKNAAPRLHRNH